MIRSVPQSVVQVAVGILLVFAVIWAWFHPGRFGDIQLLGAILSLEFLCVFLWQFERYFFAVVLLSFLFAGTAVPLQETFNVARWVVLGFGAIIGCIIWLKSSFRTVGLFHLVAAFCVLSAAVSSVVSEYPTISLAKTASLLLLFLYGSAGVRLSVLGRQERFFNGLILGLEMLVYLSAICYFVLGLKLFGNPNSLGATMGIGVFPVLLWSFLASPKSMRPRRLVALTFCCGLLLFSVTRGAILASALAAVVLCFSLREQKLLLKAGIIFVIALSLLAILAPAYYQETVTDFADEVLYKGHKDQGVLGSRRSPWDAAVREIKDHPFFGSGFGTSPTGEDPGMFLGHFHSTAEVSREHGSSYLAIGEWVGLLGVLPFIALLFLVILNIWRTCAWMMRSRNPHHYSIPLAMVIVAGLIYAGFEDWLFAAGSYLSVYFWSLAFMLADLAPRTAASLSSPVRATRPLVHPLEPVDLKR